MTENTRETVLDALPLAPRNPMPLRQQIKALRMFHSGPEVLRDAGGPVTRIKLAPKWLAPVIVVTTSPQGAHDVLGRSDAITERTRTHTEMRSLIGPNLFDVPHDEWLPRRRLLQPLFTKKHVRGYGGHMAQAADGIAESWPDGGDVDLDAECRKLTLRALGRSVLGIDLDAQSDRIAEPLRVMLQHVADRTAAPVRLPGWVPTRARRRAYAASATLRDLAADVLRAVREDPDRDAPLVRALIAATDPETGRGLTDEEIRDELIVFMGAGHDTTATTLAYALWQLGRHPEMQERVRAEAAAVGDRELGPDDVANLGYTVQVLHEALRLCPPGAASARLVMQDIDVDGYRVEAGTMVVVGIYALQRDPSLWEDATAFDPERFRPEVAKSMDRWQYLPFGAGPRTCVGDHFAMLELALALATVVRRTDIRSADPEFPMAAPFTLVASAPVMARVSRPTGQTTENASGSAARPVSADNTVSP
ncbi:cytochrome P450 [Mycobacterium sp. URHB0044]|uniref:cytochrome P450 n=1 Tax=Mycobacterium sp. URHB0044 TaxID=1380386 RepID=UPI0007E8BE16|nr:cytochrome P450 [Mycobacterium sp. URHB0044]